MTTATNGQVKTAPAALTGTAGEHVAAAEDALRVAAGCQLPETAMFYVAAAQVHATLAVALADQRIADDEDRIAGCVADGGSAFDVTVRGQR